VVLDNSYLQWRVAEEGGGELSNLT
jgi:hypothetical protein